MLLLYDVSAVHPCRLARYCQAASQGVHVKTVMPSGFPHAHIVKLPNDILQDGMDVRPSLCCLRQDCSIYWIENSSGDTKSCTLC